MYEQLALFPLPAVADSEQATGCRHCGARLCREHVPAGAAWVHDCANTPAPHHGEPTGGQPQLPFGTEAA